MNVANARSVREAVAVGQAWLGPVAFCHRASQLCLEMKQELTWMSWARLGLPLNSCRQGQGLLKLEGSLRHEVAAVGGPGQGLE